MINKYIDIFVGLIIIAMSILITGIGYMVYLEKSAVVALCGIPLVFVFLSFGFFVLFKGLKNES